MFSEGRFSPGQRLTTGEGLKLSAVGQGWQDRLEVREPRPRGLAMVVGTHRPELGTEATQVAGNLEEETREWSPLTSWGRL